MNLLVAAAGALLAVLLVVLAVTLRRLQRQDRSRRRTEDALARHNQTAHEERMKSLEMIALAGLAGDCELSEGCLRVRALLRAYPGLRGEPAFAPIEALYEEIRELPVGEARRRLPSAEVERQDEVRRAIEGRHRAAVLASLRALRERATSLAGSRFDIPDAVGVTGTHG